MTDGRPQVMEQSGFITHVLL